MTKCQSFKNFTHCSLRVCNSFAFLSLSPFCLVTISNLSANWPLCLSRCTRSGSSLLPIPVANLSPSSRNNCSPEAPLFLKHHYMNICSVAFYVFWLSGPTITVRLLGFETSMGDRNQNFDRLNARCIGNKCSMY